MRENSSVHDRLDSWKEIADYLNRDIRTAIRWGKDKGMPVHRVPGGKRQAVFAFKGEIDAWLVSNIPDEGPAGVSAKPGLDGAALATDNQPDMSQPETTHRLDPPVADSADDRARPSSTSVRTWKVLVAAAGCLLLLVSARVFFVRPSAKAAVGPFRLAKVTDDGRAKGNLRTDGSILYFNELEVYHEILVSTPVAGGPITKIDVPFANINLQDVSNDGKHLLVTSYEGTEEDRPLWIIPAHGGAADPVPDILCRYARWSPDNRRIACAAGGTITLLTPDGSDRTTWGPFPGLVGGLLWSPDGERLRFFLADPSAKTNSAWEIFAAKGERSDPRATRLAWTQGWTDGWAWIHGGEDFLYERPGGTGKPALYLRPGRETSSNGSREVELPISIGSIEVVSPAKNGTALYLLAHQGSGGQLLKFNPKEKKTEEILPGLAADDLAYSRDRQWMTYTRTSDHSLWRSRADGSDATRLTSPPMEVEFSSWSPDGRRIAFMGKEPGKVWRVYLVDRDGGPAQEAADGQDGQGAPTWSADGKFIAYGNVECSQIQACWIRLINLSTRQTEKLPNSHGFRTARWSPDGKYIAALHPETHELLLFDVRGRRWALLADSITGDNVNWSSDSHFVYADSPQGKNPAIERIRISDKQRRGVMSLSFLQNVPGQIEFWFGLTPGNDPILYHSYNASEVYALDWTEEP